MTTERDQEPVERLLADRLQVEIHEDRGNLGMAAAGAMAGRMKALLARQERVRIVFASAPSQNEFLAELGSTPGLDWRRVTAFHMDEYVGLGPEAPQSFSRFLVESLFNRVKPGAFHPLNGLAVDPEGECRRYRALLAEAPIDIVCAGIGENGHLAFNDPPADFGTTEAIHVVRLDDACRMQQVGEGHFAKLKEVPEQALSLTVPGLLSARRLLVVVPERRKAAAVKAALEGPVTPDCPASILQRQSHARLYLDRESSSLLAS